MFYSIAGVRKLEELAISHYGFSEAQLMANAGNSALMELQSKWPTAKSILVVCGKGKNGGDGYVLARAAKHAGLHALIRYIGDLDNLPAAAKAAMLACREANIDIQLFNRDEPFIGDVIVDALLGIGIKGEVQGDYRLAIDWINHTGLPVLAIDTPSGLDAEHGRVLGSAVRATVTVTFIGLKPGLFIAEGVDYSGRVICADLGMPAEAFTKVPAVATAMMQGQLAQALKPRKHSDHKGCFGHLLVIGGNYKMAGAVRMAAEAALRVGAGLVTVATRPEHIAIVNGARPEIMCHGINEASELKELMLQATVVAIGPGLGHDDWARALLAYAIEAKKPMVIDADGLNLLAQQPKAAEHWILTPHPGEAGRLLKLSSAEVQYDRLSAINKIQHQYQGVCVLKGAGTLVKGAALPALCLHGNPGMASAGMGDVLSGIIAGLLAQKLELESAAQAGVLIHALAGDAVAREFGERGMLATDLMPMIRRFANP